MATGHPLATETAVAVLRAGGSAVDAAVAADAVMGVVEPTATGVGGDVMAVVATADGVAALNGSGRSGRRTDPESVPDNGHGFVPSEGGWAVTVPGDGGRDGEELHQPFRPGRDGPTLFEPAIAGSRRRSRRGQQPAAGCGRVLGAASTPRARSSTFRPAPPRRRARGGATPTLAAVLATDRGRWSLRRSMAVACPGPSPKPPDRRGRERAHRRPCRPPQRMGGAAASEPGGAANSSQIPPPCQGAVTALAAQSVHDRGMLGAAGEAAGAEAAATMAEALDRAFAVALECLADPDGASTVPRLRRDAGPDGRRAPARTDAPRTGHGVHGGVHRQSRWWC